MKDEAKSTLLHAAAGVGVGYLQSSFGTGTLIIIGLAVLYVLRLVVKQVFKKSKTAWWIGNGVWVYLTVWFAVWVTMINI